MSCTYLNNEIDSMFDNEPNDLHNDTLLSDKLLWNSDNLSMTSNDINWDTLIYDDITSHSFDLLPDKSKDKLLDFDYNLLECNDLFESTIKNPVKLEPTHTNSVSSSYLTDDCSPNSSHHNSPIGRKVRKRDFQAIDSSSEKSFALYEECVEHPPKTAKVEVIKREMVHHSPRTIYKLSRDSKFEAREPIIINGGTGQRQIVKIRHQTSTSAPYIVSGSGIKSVNIPKFTTTGGQGKLFTAAPVSALSQRDHSPMPDQDCDLLTGDYYDHEVDLYADYKPRLGPVSYSIGQQHQTGSVFGGGGGNNGQHGTGSGALFQTPIPQSGPLYLTDEEKRTLLQENYPIPTRVPLTKQEERNLKKVRRKIKNKLSAQESRRKKKEYVDALEKKVEAYEQERVESKRRIETLENQQRTLQNQIRHYQHQMMNKITGTGNTTSTGLMLFMICFALILVGGSMPSSYRRMNLPQSSLISSSAIYYMGYGPARNAVNGSDDDRVLMNQRHAVPDKPDRLLDRAPEIDVIPRQSILLGEDGDDRNFEELLLSYSGKSPRRICGAGSSMASNLPRRPTNTNRNTSSNRNTGNNRNSSLGGGRSSRVDDIVMIARLANMPLVVK